MEKTLRQLLLDYPNSGQKVIGLGTVHVDAEEIRQSRSYKTLIAQVRNYVQTGEKPKMDDSGNLGKYRKP